MAIGSIHIKRNCDEGTWWQRLNVSYFPGLEEREAVHDVEMFPAEEEQRLRRVQALDARAPEHVTHLRQ